MKQDFPESKGNSRFRMKPQWRKYAFIVSLFFATGFVIFKTFPSISQFQYTYERGCPWKYEEITAPFAFEIQKSEKELEEERVSLLKDFAPIFDKKEDIHTSNIKSFKAKAASNNEDEATRPYFSYIERKLNAFYKIGIISTSEIEKLKGEGVGKIRVITNNISKDVPLEHFLTTKSAYEKIINDAPSDLDKNTLRDFNIDKYIEENILLNEEKTEGFKKDLLKTISQTKGRVQKGEKIIDHGEIITESAFDILNSYKLKTEEDSRQKNRGLIAVGQGLIITISLLVLFLYFHLFRQKFLEEKRDIVVILSLVLILCIITSWAVKHEVSPYLIPYALTAITVTTFFDTRTALFTHLTTVLLCSFIVPNEYEFLFLQVIVGMISICTLKNVFQRSHLIRSALLIVISYIALYIGFSLIHEKGIGQIDWTPIQYFLINGVLLLFANPFIYIIEKTFGYTSDASLVELSNTNNPLLRKFSEVAPGSFQHSMQVSNLATEAAIALKDKANPILVRTAALYHDIGKMKNPEFFTENQSGSNPHAGLSEIESAKKIIAHVENGVKIAKDYNIPEKIQDFIRTHHGGSQTKYFLYTYKNNHPDETVDEAWFTYPGPKPWTREMCILTMCDAVEAASRSLTEYTDENINNLVEKIINGQLQDGVFDQAPISLSQITTIKSVLKEKLKKIYHTRISYPELKKQ